MVRVTGPLFGSCGAGGVGNAGSFRQTGTGTTFIKPRDLNKKPTPDQQRIQNCMKAAMYSWGQIPKSQKPYWPNYWWNWQIQHVECREEVVFKFNEPLTQSDLIVRACLLQALSVWRGTTNLTSPYFYHFWTQWVVDHPDCGRWTTGVKATKFKCW